MCTNCIQHSIDCDYQLSASRSPSRDSTTSQPQRFRFRQSKYQSQICQLSHEQSGSTIRSQGVQCDLTRSVEHDSGSGESISPADLYLFHHFVTSTYRTFAGEEGHAVWQVYVPRWGFSFPSIMHLLLTLSALHLAVLNQTNRDENIKKADEHFTFGVRSVTASLALHSLTSENCQQIYISAVMICFAYFARGPRAGEYLVFNAKGKSEWLVLLRGVRAILEQKQSEIFTGVLAPTEKKRPEEVPNHELDNELALHVHHLQHVRATVMAEVPAVRDLYSKVMDDLIRSFQGVYRERKAGSPPCEFMPFTMGWTFRLSEAMVERLEDREPLALVILAHWAILLRYMNDVWFMRGWDRHIVTGVWACLPPTHHALIAWAEEIILNETYDCKQMECNICSRRKIR